jgi:hypothetical protein
VHHDVPVLQICAALPLSPRPLSAATMSSVLRFPVPTPVWVPFTLK